MLLSLLRLLLTVQTHDLKITQTHYKLGNNKMSITNTLSNR